MSTPQLPERIKLAEFARRMGVDAAAIRRMIAKQLLTPPGHDSRFAWPECRDEYVSNVRQRVDYGLRGSDGESEDDETTGVSNAYNAARAAKATADAELSRLKVDKELSNLLPLSQVVSEVSQSFSALRDLLLVLPYRLKDALAGESDPENCRVILDAEIRDILSGFASKYQRPNDE